MTCASECRSDPPSAPTNAISDWDKSTKMGGTIVTYTCPGKEEYVAVCDANTLNWEPAAIPDC